MFWMIADCQSIFVSWNVAEKRYTVNVALIPNMDLKFKNWKIKILFLVSLIFVFLQNDLCGFASWASRCPAVHWQRIESFLNIPKSSVFERRATVIALIALPQGPCTRNWECWMRSSKTDARTPPKESINSRLFKRWVFFHVVAAYHL